MAADFSGLMKQLQNMSSKMKKTKTENAHLKLDVKQNKSFSTLSSLLEKSATALVCGPHCQKEKKEQALKTKYLAAETSIQTAPVELEQSRKNYLVFSKGESYYDDLREKELAESARKLAGALYSEFSIQLDLCDTLNSFYQGSLINKMHMDELFQSYLLENINLRELSSNERHDVLTNERKTFYENMEIESLKKIYKLFFILFFILFFTLVLISSSSLVFLLVIFSYPFLIFYLVRWIISWVSFLFSLLPFNIYRTI